MKFEVGKIYEYFSGPEFDNDYKLFKIIEIKDKLEEDEIRNFMNSGPYYKYEVLEENGQADNFIRYKHGNKKLERIFVTNSSIYRKAIKSRKCLITYQFNKWLLQK